MSGARDYVPVIITEIPRYRLPNEGHFALVSSIVLIQNLSQEMRICNYAHGSRYDFFNSFLDVIETAGLKAAW